MFRKQNTRIDELAALDPFAACSNKQLEDVARLSDDVTLSSLQFAAVADHCPAVARRVMGTLAQRLRDVQAA